jgi:hypothetical protein
MRRTQSRSTIFFSMIFRNKKSRSVAAYLGVKFAYIAIGLGNPCFKKCNIPININNAENMKYLS